MNRSTEKGWWIIMLHSKTLEETKLWQYYKAIIPNEERRIGWTREIVTSGCNQLKMVTRTFENYTLHDETHVLNVLDAMAGLLGERIVDLKAGEAELLIISAALHDIGMVYTDTEKEKYLYDTDKLKLYTKNRSFDIQGRKPQDWDDSVKQDYYRWLHPYRLDDVLEQSFWRRLFNDCPSNETADIDTIIAICRSHGESAEWIRKEATEPGGAFNYLLASEIDPLFCSIMLRLADILDFDDSRTPGVLFSYTGKDSKSVGEWKKHMGSAGFNYSLCPSEKQLPYRAKCKDPNTERIVRTFLDWIDDELTNSRDLVQLCYDRWRHFSFPYKVDRKEIKSVGYDFGDFRITMDQQQIMNLFTGENLYPDKSVFVRELLQNSIDATLLRARMDSVFECKLNTDDARIDLWEWNDALGNHWFRIDDNGTGMTRGMLNRYFLKAGSSYYTSKELQQDLQGKKFTGIGRFGIGFLSCFLCGFEAQVSTLYWNPQKNLIESEMRFYSPDKTCFGLRFDVTGISGWYTLWSQAIRDNHPSHLPAPPDRIFQSQKGIEKDGFRTRPGTSIAIRLNDGKLGRTDIRSVVLKYLNYPRMPVYFNGSRLCKTTSELINLARNEAGTKQYDLSLKDKAELDSYCPPLSGMYLVSKEAVNIFEAGRINGLPNVTVVVGETEILLPQNSSGLEDSGWNISDGSRPHAPAIIANRYIQKTDSGGVLSLSDPLVFPSCDARKIWYELSNKQLYIYHGIIVRDEHRPEIMMSIPIDHYDNRTDYIIIDESSEQLNMSLDRSHLIGLPLKTAVTLHIWTSKMHIDLPILHPFIDSHNEPLAAWREITTKEFLEWAQVEDLEAFQCYQTLLSNPKIGNDGFNIYPIIYSMTDVMFSFLTSYIQQKNCLTVEYEAGQIIEYRSMDNNPLLEKVDLFPPMLFCYGKTAKDRRWLCSADRFHRLAITADHPFSVWLIDNAAVLKEYYTQQFPEIVYSLRNEGASTIISAVDMMRNIVSLSGSQYNLSPCPILSKEDFWGEENEVELPLPTNFDSD